MASRLQQEAIDRLSGLSSGRISMEEFEDWSASYSWSIHKTGDEKAKEIAYEVRAILNDRSEDPSEQHTRLELEKAMRRFLPV